MKRERLIIVALFLFGLGLRWAMTAHWCFAGSDSYGYMKISDEIRRHHRFALGPDEPGQWARLPLYPLFLTIKGEAVTDMNWRGDAEKAPGWLRITRAQSLVDVLVTALLVWLMVRRLAGPRAGAWALGVALFNPFTTPFVGAVLTETLAIALTTAAMAPLILLSEKPKRAFALSGALLGLGMLLRADALLGAAAFPPALYFLCRGWRQRLTCGALALVTSVLVWHVWPVRNLHQFGALHPIGARIDRDSRPLENVDGYWRWLRSFARTWQPTTYAWTCYYDHSPACNESIIPELERLHAFDSDPEKSRVQRLLDRRAKQGLTAAVDGEFAKLADERFHSRPLFGYVVLPLLRAGNMWVTWYLETLSNPAWRPLKPLTDVWWETIFPLSLIQELLTIAAAIYLWRRKPALRWLVATLIGMMAARTAILGWTAYCMPRYATEMMPLAWVLIATGATFAIGEWRQRRSRS